MDPMDSIHGILYLHGLEHTIWEGRLLVVAAVPLHILTGEVVFFPDFLSHPRIAGRYPGYFPTVCGHHPFPSCSKDFMLVPHCSP